MAKARYSSIKDLKKSMKPHGTMTPAELRAALGTRPESFGGRYNGRPPIRLDPYGQLLDEVPEPSVGSGSSNQSYGGKKYGHSKHGSTPRGRKEGELAKKAQAIVIIAISLIGMFLISPNITGNVIGNLTLKSPSFLGIGLIIIGLISGFFWLRNNRN